MRELHLFAGAGGGILGGLMLGNAQVPSVAATAFGLLMEGTQ